MLWAKFRSVKHIHRPNALCFGLDGQLGSNWRLRSRRTCSGSAHPQRTYLEEGTKRLVDVEKFKL